MANCSSDNCPIGHLSELTLICKPHILILNEMASLAIKIPKFKQNLCNLELVYPVPNNESKLIISPSKYYCNELWYNKCEEVNSQWICSGPIANGCILQKNCQYATVLNNFKVHTLTYKNALLFCTKIPETIYEDCFQFQKIILKDCNLIQSQCDVIIGQHKYSLAINNISVINSKIIKIPNTNKSINLKIRHLQDPKKIQEYIINPIHLYDLPMNNYVLTTILAILLCCLAFIIYHWQK